MTINGANFTVTADTLCNDGSVEKYFTGGAPSGWSLGALGSGGWRANEPAGMTALEPRDFNAQVETGWWDAGSTYFEIISDSSSNYGGASCGQINYPAGYAGGFAPTSTGKQPANSALWGSASQEVYLCFEIMFSPNWQPHPTGTNKVFFLTMSGLGNNGAPAFLSLQTNLDSGAAPWQMSLRDQGTGATSGNEPDGTLLATQTITPGQWHLVEIHLVANSSAGSTDGEQHTWIDGVKTQEDLSCTWSSVGAGWDSVRWEPTWGGGGGTVAEDMYQRISKISVSVK